MKHVAGAVSRTNVCRVLLQLMAGVVAAVILASCGDSGSPTAPPPTGASHEPLPAAPRTLVNQGSRDGVSWKVFTSAAANDGRCLYLDLVPPPPVPLIGASCSPAPSLTSFQSQPLYSSQVGQDGPGSAYYYVAGLAAPEIGEIRVDFSDGSTDVTRVVEGTFFVLFPSTTMIAALRPVVPAFPDLRCEVQPLEGAGGYADGGCRGYTFRVPRSAISRP